jgi:hypothetical protein
MQLSYHIFEGFWHIDAGGRPPGVNQASTGVNPMVLLLLGFELGCRKVKSQTN